MSVFYLGNITQKEDFENLYSSNDLNCNLLYRKSKRKALFQKKEARFLFNSAKPVFKDVDYNSAIHPISKNFKTIITEGQNNFCTIDIEVKNGLLTLSVSSARIGRDRIYFFKSENGVYLSDDIRELIPLTNRKFNPNAFYSILKFGDTPEFITCIEGINCVPVGSFWTGDVQSFINSIQINDFTPYYKMSYDFMGGDIKETHSILDSVFSYLGKQDVLLPISGGVDSSIINYMINDHRDDHYPAYYMRFGDDDPEVEFAKAAVKNTKADLRVYEMKSVDFIEAFNFQSKTAIQPIGESSTIAIAYFFKQCEFEDHLVLDGTLADGCYGSTNYLEDCPVPPPKSNLRSKAEENIASHLQLKHLPGGYKFFPRDSFIEDSFIQQLNIYVGPLGNTLFKNVKGINSNIEEYFKYYYQLLETKGDLEKDDWMKYSLFKMYNYASKNNTAKSFDNVGIANSACYPFMWKEVLDNQGKYSWKEKTQDGVIKFPLKKILESYADKDFIYRKKVGLNSSFEEWVCTQQNKKFLTSIIEKKESLALVLMGKSNIKKLMNHFNSYKPVHPNVARLVINLALSQSWIDEHNLQFG